MVRQDFPDSFDSAGTLMALPVSIVTIDNIQPVQQAFHLPGSSKATIDKPGHCELTGTQIKADTYRSGTKTNECHGCLLEQNTVFLGLSAM